jgi:hypothetical protein
MSIEDGCIITPNLMSGVVEKITGKHPDLFTPIQLSQLLNQKMVEQVLDGATPGLIKKDIDSDDAIFNPIFSKKQMQIVRSNLESEFDVEIPNISIIETPYRISNFPTDSDREEALIEVGKFKMTSTAYTIKSEDIQPDLPTFNEIFGYNPNLEK